MCLRAQNKKRFRCSLQKGHEVKLGSECIESYEGLEGVRREIERRNKEEKERIKKEKATKEYAEFEDLYDDYDNMRRDLRVLALKGIYLPKHMWGFSQNISQYCANTDTCKTYKGKLKKLRAWMARYEADILAFIEENKKN